MRRHHCAACRRVFTPQMDSKLYTRLHPANGLQPYAGVRPEAVTVHSHS